MVRYNRMEDRFCWVVPRVKSFGLSFYLRRLAFERPVVPFAPLPLSGWNTAPCLLVSTPPGWVVFGRGGRMLPGWASLWVGRASCGGKHFFFCLPGGGLFSACPAGAKTTFSFDSKEKAVLDSEKEKVDRRKFWGGAEQQDGGPILLGCSSGKIHWAILLSSAACV